MIKAEIIADSINPLDCRLTTFILRFPRMVLAELNTHRVLSKNSASSRAIPFEKMLEMVIHDPFVPIRFQKDHKGMQGTEYFVGDEHGQCVKDWLAARDSAVKSATDFKFPVTKQLRNRLLEPFMWHTVILSGTELANFFALRLHQDAEIHICELASKMLEAYNESTPKSLKPGEWHIPFGDKIDDKRLESLSFVREEVEKLDKMNYSGDYSSLYVAKNAAKKKIAIARCARVSYHNFEGKDDYEADIRLCDRLFGAVPRHMSPTEHVAQSLNCDKFYGNFRGFKQYRKFFSDENILTDSRMIKKHYQK